MASLIDKLGERIYPRFVPTSRSSIAQNDPNDYSKLGVITKIQINTKYSNAILSSDYMLSMSRVEVL
ncbi:hypothetical protein H5410_065029 [Solanum commersonii]|uniref:Uncharacterized protein n=1 Tax=Solanum commersonii TaxID=4109 RepID=A0A9J5VXP7_SOLCO|nr:hypothetical protein H5410_065029 [Solanum commersonii]